MQKITQTILPLLISFFITACSQNSECNKFKNKKTLNKLKHEISYMRADEKAHELYLYGECKVVIAKPILMSYKNNKKINHHLRHKGMSLGYIASGSLKKLEGE